MEMEDFGFPPVFPVEVIQTDEEKELLKKSEEIVIKDKSKGKKVNTVLFRKMLVFLLIQFLCSGKLHVRNQN